MNQKIKELVDRYKEKGDFTYKTITDEQIAESQILLSVELPVQFIEFLQTYGHGGIGGVEVLGVGKNSHLLFVEETLKYREHALPYNLIIVENCDEWVYCIDTKDSSVVSWDGKNIKEAYPDFDSYLQGRFTEAIENL